MPHRNVELTDHLEEFIDTNIASGRFNSASEVIREALGLLERQEDEDLARIEWLRETAQSAFASLDRGEGTELRSREELENHLRAISAQAFEAFPSQRGE